MLIRCVLAVVFVAVVEARAVFPSPVAKQVEDCIALCADGEADSDGDGLSDCEESCAGTDSDAVDSDGDGMADGFEVEFGLDPLVSDGHLDGDGDALSNLDEYLQNSDPTDATSPVVVYFVAPDGSDEAGTGSAQEPWQTVSFAIQAVESSIEAPVRIVLREGAYTGNIALDAGLILTAAPDANVTLVGPVVGASQAVLEDLTLMAGEDTEYLLDMDDVSMTLSGVTFLGNEARDRTGVRMDGTAPARSVFEYCTFRYFGIGLDIGDGVPTIRHCVFDDFPATFGPDNATGVAILIRDNGRTGEDWRSIGDESDPGNGWNDFLPTIAGFAVINERTDAVTMQNNFWGVTDPALFPTRVNGAAVVQPILLNSSAVLATSIFCTVWDDATQQRIELASVDLFVSPFDVEERNHAGVYSFLCLQDGSYTIEVNAPGFETAQVNVSVAPGELKAVGVPMSRRGTVRDTSTTAEATSGGCALQPAVALSKIQDRRGDLVLMALSVAVLMVLGRYRGQP